MSKLQNFTWITAISILSLTTIKTCHADVLNNRNKPKSVLLTQQNHKAIATITKANQAQLAQNYTASSNEDEMIDALQKRQQKIEDLKELNEITPNTSNLNKSTSSEISKPLAFKMLTIGLPGTILLIVIAIPLVKGVMGIFGSKINEEFGKPKVPEGAISLHNSSIKEITIIGNQAQQINDHKFGNEEFKLLIQIKINTTKAIEDYPELDYKVQLLKAAIIAQKSFLKLEATELRYRSRKQQEFYQYIADNLQENQDREEFAQKVQNKQIEILPLITTEEGKSAIESYGQEINTISQYALGLKLLALFKQYNLQDFSILKNISDVVESLEGKDLLSVKDLISLILEKYNSFEKLAPILGILEAENSPKTYAKILQVIGLNNRHGKAYLEFEQLVKLLKKWEQPYKSISMVRQEYTSDQYQIPSEFKQEIPGIETYRKYAQYLPDL